MDYCSNLWMLQFWVEGLCFGVDLELWTWIRQFPENIGRLMCGMVNSHYKMNTLLSHCVLFRDLDQFLLVFFFTSLLSKIKKWKLIHFMYCISMQITESTKHTIHLHAHIVLAIIKVCFCLADCRHHLLHNIEYKNSTRNIQNVRVVSKANKQMTSL